MAKLHLEKGHPLSAFTPDAAGQLDGPPWLAGLRSRGWERFSELDLPTADQEFWRYSPIEHLKLDAFNPVVGRPVADAAAPVTLHSLDVSGLMAAAATSLVVRDGWVEELPSPMPGVSVTRLSQWPDRAEAEPLIGRSAHQSAPHAFDELHQAFSPDQVIIDVEPGAVITQPLVVRQIVGGSASGKSGFPAVFPGMVVRLGRGATLRLVEVVTQESTSPALVVPRTMLWIGDGAQMSHVSVQVLGGEAWHLGRLAAQVGRDATLRSFTAGLGAEYDRLETEVEVVAPGGRSELRSVYLGSGTQVHDVRTLQDHAAPSTVSDLLCKGAVAGSARSIYTGLIRIRPGAVRTDALQTNHNLVLGEHAHADSIPNLDIQENEVRCSHASSVGPIDRDQRYYLESRGIVPDRAERLIVSGFFDDIVDRCPVPAACSFLRRVIGRQVAAALEAPEIGTSVEATTGAEARS